MSGRVRIIGPREDRKLLDGEVSVDATSKSGWSSDLSPFLLGPCKTIMSYSSKTMENAWQYLKVYADQVDDEGAPDGRWWAWAKEGWANPRAVRYPRGKGAKPLYAFWHGQRLGYVEARKAIYWPLYRDAVAGTRGYARLKAMVEAGQDVAIFDFDGYDHDAQRLSIGDVIERLDRPMGHAFVLKAMLVLGEAVTPDQAAGIAAAPRPGRQASLDL